MSVRQPVRRRPAGVGGEHDAAGPVGESLADVVERMFGLFETQLSLPTIVLVVRRCRRELDISGPPLAGMLERLARQRLANLTNATGPNAARPGRSGL